MMHKAWRSIVEVLYCFFRSSIKFQGYMGKKIDDLIPILSKITRLVAAIKSLGFLFLRYHVLQVLVMEKKKDLMLALSVLYQKYLE